MKLSSFSLAIIGLTAIAVAGLPIRHLRPSLRARTVVNIPAHQLLHGKNAAHSGGVLRPSDQDSSPGINNPPPPGP